MCDGNEFGFDEVLYEMLTVVDVFAVFCRRGLFGDENGGFVVDPKWICISGQVADFHK